MYKLAALYCILPKILSKFTHAELKISKLCHNDMIYLELLICKQCEFCYQETSNTPPSSILLTFRKARMHRPWSIHFLFVKSFQKTLGNQ